MYRNLTFRPLERLQIGVKCKQILKKYQHEPVGSANEIQPKIVNLYEQTKEESKEENEKEERKEFIVRERPKLTSGEVCWNNFYQKYQNRRLTPLDLVNLFKGVTAEAQYKRYKEAPSAAYTLSCCGAFPLASIGVISLLAGNSLPSLAYFQLTYSASILSFLGGTAWAHMIAKDNLNLEKCGWAVLPPLLGWSSIFLPLPAGFALVTSGLAASMVHDVLLTSYPQWFKSLRYILTMVTLVSFLPTFCFTVFRF